MFIPDVTSPKVLYPAIAFYIVGRTIPDHDWISKLLAFAVLYRVLISTFSNVVVTTNDEILTAVVHYVFAHMIMNDLTHNTVYFAFTLALIRGFFPQLLY
jgi:hypothetical protein